MKPESFFQQRLICVAVIDRSEDAVPLAEALLAGGLKVIEVTFRTASAADSIARISKQVPDISVGAGTLLSIEQVREAIGVGAQFGVSPGLNERIIEVASEREFPFFPGIMTPTEAGRALDLGARYLKFFPAAVAGGAAMLKALAGPFAHTGVKFIPTGGINISSLPDYLAIPQVAAVGGSWMAERKLIADKNWKKISALAAEAIAITSK
jgi:2-dehydro-3-deoxyphosphogluconate aldolase/(4S)-4-hydroxy-2-oxoglutarate aldolase